jgi:hypothetical protein
MSPAASILPLRTFGAEPMGEQPKSPEMFGLIPAISSPKRSSSRDEAQQAPYNRLSPSVSMFQSENPIFRSVWIFHGNMRSS